VFFTLPARAKGEAEADAPLAVQARQLLRQDVWLSYVTIAIIMVGQLAFGTFQVAILTNITGLDVITQVPFYLLIGGAGAVIGIWLGGKGADWRIGTSLLLIIAGQVVCFGLLLVSLHQPVFAAVMLFFTSAFGFGFSTPIQVRILNGARAAPRLAATMVSTAYNIGIAAGAFLGASLLTGGMDYARLPAVGVVCSAVAGIVFAISLRLARAPAAT
jgi:DHA1 family inner membrane transport protein